MSTLTFTAAAPRPARSRRRAGSARPGPQAQARPGPQAQARPGPRGQACPRPQALPRLRLTRRGRLLALLVLLALISALLLGMARAVGASTRALSTPALTTLVVHPGQTLWEIALKVAPADDPRDTVIRLEQLNGMGSAVVRAGQTLLVPAASIPAASVPPASIPAASIPAASIPAALSASR